MIAILVPHVSLQTVWVPAILDEGCPSATPRFGGQSS